MDSDPLLSATNYDSAGPYLPWINHTEKAKFLMKGTGLRVVVGLVCTLSILGSLLIILAYILFKSRRSRTREILVNISIMDFGVALSNLIGLSVYFDKYYYENDNHPPNYIVGLCKTQAFFAAFCTYGSVFWTIILAAYIYLLLMQYSKRKMLYFLIGCYIVAYGLSMLLSLWLIFTERLGFSPYDSAGWCSLRDFDLSSRETDIFVAFFAYDFWMYLAIILIPLFYLATRCYVTYYEQVRLAKKFVDYRFLLIPVVFLLLRVWTCIIGILYDYVQLEWEAVPNSINQILLYLSGIGDSGQGFANAILFLVFSKGIRQSVIQCIQCKKSTNIPLTDEENPTSPSPMTSVTTTKNTTTSRSSSSSSSEPCSPTEKTGVLSGSVIGIGEHSDKFQSYRHNYGTLN